MPGASQHVAMEQAIHKFSQYPSVTKIRNIKTKVFTPLTALKSLVEFRKGFKHFYFYNFQFTLLN